MNTKHKSFPRSVSPLLALLFIITTALAFDNAPRRATADSSSSLVLQPSSFSSAKRALVVSLDGLDARYLREPDRYGLKIPTLRRLMKEGATARGGVLSVYPSVTYPNHATMATGALPARHGIFTNEVFDPAAPQAGAWHWFARDLKADTLWDAAGRGGLSTALVSWPVSTGAGDWNVPEIWKAGVGPSALEATLAEMTTHQRPAGLLEEVARRDPALYANVTMDEGDDMRTRFAEYLIEQKRPGLVFVHLFDLDHFQHDFGPFTPEAHAALEKSDAYLARLLAAAERAGTLAETAVFVMSDHGFRAYTTQIRPNVILARAGLIKVREEKDAAGRARAAVAEWRAFASTTGGSCAVMLRDPNDKDALTRALAAFAAHAGVGRGAGGKKQVVLRVLNQREVGRAGANPKAAFMLEAAEGYSFDARLDGEPIVEGERRGQHGYLPTTPDYRASFIASGAGIDRGEDLGEIRMIDIGPTIARALGLTLRHADGRALKLR